MSDFILAIDQGTTSTRSIVFDDSADDPRLRAGRSFRSTIRRPAGSSTSRRISGGRRSRPRAARSRRPARGRRTSPRIGITNQRETTLVWDRRTGKPIHRAIVWQDRRTADICARLRERGRGAARSPRRPGCCSTRISPAPRSPGCSTTSPGARALAEAGHLAFGTVDTYLLWRLTGGPRPRHRRHQRLAHAALRHPPQRLGRRALGALARAARACCRR